MSLAYLIMRREPKPAKFARTYMKCEDQSNMLQLVRVDMWMPNAAFGPVVA
jgi:hypothetical protein